jgi:hypothetical protein
MLLLYDIMHYRDNIIYKYHMEDTIINADLLPWWLAMHPLLAAGYREQKLQ